MKTFTEEERYNYDLNPESIVIDCGAYHGHFSKRIWDKYKCCVFAYEPTSEFYSIACEIMRETGVTIFKLGVSNKYKTIEFGIANDSTGEFKESTDTKEKVILQDICQVVSGYNLVALLKLNIEGGEFDVIQRLVDSSLISIINNIQVQFHTCVPNAQERYHALAKRLSETHHLTYDAGAFIWQNWEINK